MKKTVYRCEFMFASVGNPVGRHVYGACLGDFMDGFWITDEGEFTKGMDAKHWIPPNAIKYVSKDKVQRD